jgi:poly-gamma-glutamate capsule biosynthesis protein CapA/YwtB (metallophosphatase superfamily)
MQSHKPLVLSVLLAAFLTGCGVPTAGEGLLVERQVTMPPPPPPSVRLTFVGDIMLDRLPGQALERGEDPFTTMAPLLQADIVVGNLECVIATKGERVPKAYNFRASPKAVPLLARYFSAVSVANNHSGDFGKDAFAEQLDLLRAGGVPYFGGGQNSREAYSPLILERNGIRVALLGYNEIELRSYEAGPDKPGLAWIEDRQVLAEIAAAKATADFVIVYPHWGLEYHAEPSERQRILARSMIDAGADLVVGSHPHVTQGAEYYKDRLIIYSLGNFVFDDYRDVSAALNEPSRTSWVLRVELGPAGLKSWDTVVARTDDSGIPRPVPGAQGPCGKVEAKEIGLCKAG